MATIVMACQITYYLIMGYGFYVCWRAYRSNKKKAWLLVGVFCLSAFFALGMSQFSKAMLRRAWNQPYQEQVLGDSNQLIPVRTTTVSLPIFPLLLVIGLSFLAEDEIKRVQNAQPVLAKGGESVAARPPPVA